MDEKLRQEFHSGVEREPFAKKFGIRLLEIGTGYSKVQMKFTPDMENLFGMAHGGALFALIDEAFETDLKKSLMRRSGRLRAGDCAACELWEHCHGGCPVDGHIGFQAWQQKTIFCVTKQILFPNYVYPVHGLGHGNEKQCGTVAAAQ